MVANGGTMKHLLPALTEHKVIIGSMIAILGATLLLVSTVSQLHEMLLGVCLIVSGNQITFYDRIIQAVRLANGPSRAIWEDGVEFGTRQCERTHRPVLVSIRRNVEEPERRFSSS